MKPQFVNASEVDIYCPTCKDAGRGAVKCDKINSSRKCECFCFAINSCYSVNTRVS
jgi:hypothetical protein